jgi:hypothetical protein
VHGRCALVCCTHRLVVYPVRPHHRQHYAGVEYSASAASGSLLGLNSGHGVQARAAALVVI